MRSIAWPLKLGIFQAASHYKDGRRAMQFRWGPLIEAAAWGQSAGMAAWATASSISIILNIASSTRQAGAVIGAEIGAHNPSLGAAPGFSSRLEYGARCAEKPSTIAEIT